MESGNMCLALHFCCPCIISILGNSATPFGIKAKGSIHEPHVSPCTCWLLAIVELRVLLFDSQDTRLDPCLSLMFFIWCFSTFYGHFG